MSCTLDWNPRGLTSEYVLSIVPVVGFIVRTYIKEEGAAFDRPKKANVDSFALTPR
jgi:hypothetical protein